MTATVIINAIVTNLITMHAIDLNAIAQTSAVQIVDCLVEGTLIAIFAALVLTIVRRQNSRTRFAVWFSALMAIAALPFLSGGLWAHATGSSAVAAGQPAITLPGSWALYLFVAWALLAACQFVGVGRGLWHLFVLRKSCVAVDPVTLDARVQETLAFSQSHRKVSLYTSERVKVPTAIGLVDPAIVVPRWVLNELSSEDLNQILLHELAHLRRWDDWTNLAQKIVKALFCFHPAVWWIERRVSLEREMACDDAVLAETASPHAYAECLTHLAERTMIRRSAALAQAALGRIRQTSLRVAQILDANRPVGDSRGWKPAAALVGAFAVVCVVGISRAPQLIAFSDPATIRVANEIGATGTQDADVERMSYGTQAPNLAASKTVDQPARVVPASLKIAEHSPQQISKRKAAVLTPATAARAGSMDRGNRIHLTKANATPVAFTETFFVVVQSSVHGSVAQPVFQIQMWRLTVLHPVIDPDSNRIPPKQT
jgi:beta-lactamase regulating signal transducer with metallopeptidase domain